jgi:hypothetical protein
MTSDELEGMEVALEVRLPAFFRTAALEGRLAKLLNADARSAIAITRAFRAGDFGDENWPNHLLAFADNGSGDFFCLDLSTSAKAVLCRDHETLEITHEADDFDAWLEDYET